MLRKCEPKWRWEKHGSCVLDPPKVKIGMKKATKGGKMEEKNSWQKGSGKQRGQENGGKGESRTYGTHCNLRQDTMQLGREGNTNLYVDEDGVD